MMQAALSSPQTSPLVQSTSIAAESSIDQTCGKLQQINVRSSGSESSKVGEFNAGRMVDLSPRGHFEIDRGSIESCEGSVDGCDGNESFSPRLKLFICDRKTVLPQVKFSSATMKALAHKEFHGMMNPIHMKTLKGGEDVMINVIKQGYLGKKGENDPLSNKFYSNTVSTERFNPNAYGPIAAVFSSSNIEEESGTGCKFVDVNKIDYLLVPNQESKDRVVGEAKSERPKIDKSMLKKVVTYDELNAKFEKGGRRFPMNLNIFKKPV